MLYLDSLCEMADNFCTAIFGGGLVSSPFIHLFNISYVKKKKKTIWKIQL